MAVSVVYPVRTLRDLVTTLEAAIIVTLAGARRKTVHHLRTTTRRIEAQLELLALLPDLPEHAQPAQKAHKLLRKLRRAAGRVRDLDVQRDLTESKSREAHKLRDLFKRQRGEAAESLLEMLRKHQSRLTRVLETLLKTLSSSESYSMSATSVARLTLSWYADHAPPVTRQDHRQLHDIRKAAKLARYIAESADSVSTRRLALTFESLQQSGGDWHDWLTLSAIAHRELGASSPLARSFARHCEKSLAEYQSQLEALPENLAHSKPRNI